MSCVLGFSSVFRPLGLLLLLLVTRSPLFYSIDYWSDILLALLFSEGSDGLVWRGMGKQQGGSFTCKSRVIGIFWPLRL